MNENTKVGDESAPNAATGTWEGKHVYLMAIVCLILGVTVGYLVRGSGSPSASETTMQSSAVPSATPHEPPSLEKMKQMADKSAAPLLDKIKAEPNNFDALNDAGKLYRATHQFKEAATYYERALQVDPKNVATRTDLASCLYYIGDVDGALAQLDKALTYDPKFFGALLNIGIIRIQAKNDPAGAIRSWEKILESDADTQHRETAKKLIADAKQQNNKQSGDTPKTDGQ
jgi:cytochrome c-type biogenesis protein CcmH/NrfG